MCIPSVRLPIVLPSVLPTRIVLLVLLPLELQLDVYKKYVLRLNEYIGVEGESGVSCCVVRRVMIGDVQEYVLCPPSPMFSTNASKLQASHMCGCESLLVSHLSPC